MNAREKLASNQTAHPLTAPTTYERLLLTRGHQHIAGVDEVGRGCWAGPVVAAAVVLRAEVLQQPTPLLGVTDSKQLTARQRTAFVPVIRRAALAVAVGSVPAWLVDHLGIVAATRLAMEQAVWSLAVTPDVLLVDAMTLPHWPRPQQALIKGDSRSLSIAAASIIAKVARDSMMEYFDRCYPHRFGQHKGYGTPAHQHAIHMYGLTPQHRRSFRPLWGL